MAELIPAEYRLQAAIRARIRWWTVVGAFALAASGLGVACSALQEHRSAGALAVLQASYQQRSGLIDEADKLAAQRQVVADRMGKIEQLMDDRVLLGLLQQIAAGFSSNDHLEYIHIDARGASRKDASDAAQTDAEDHYIVSISGMTTNTSTLAALMSRLSAPARMPVSVMLDKSNRQNVIDGQVVEFQITCERSKPPANSAG